MPSKKNMFADLGKKTTVKKTHKEVAVEQKKSSEPTKKPKPSKPFKESKDGFTRSTISIPDDFMRFLHEEVLYVGIKKKQMTKVIMELLEEKYGKDFMAWKNNE